MLYRPPQQGTQSIRQRVYSILDEVKNNATKAAEAVYDGDPELALYVLKKGIQAIRQQRNNAKKRKLYDEVINPKFIQRRGGVTGSVIRVRNRTKREQQKIDREIASVWAEYNIGSLNLEFATKEQLLAEAMKERASSKGHDRNAMFLERLAEPLRPGEACPKHWDTRAVDLLREEIWRD